jgi:dTDP-glucose 4,6-dehydratase
MPWQERLLMSTQFILVTGAAGFLGSHLCDALLSEGHRVLGVDNLSTGRMANLEHLHQEQRFSFEELDICQPFDLGHVDCVFNMASPASPVDYMRLGLETLRVGSAGTLNTLEIAKKYNAGYLHASTSECYGDPLVHPQVESYWGNVNPIGPRSVYDEAKRFSEAAVAAYHRYYNVNTHLVRIFNTYGPRLQANDGRVISNFMMQALRGEPLTVYGDGLQTRSFCYCADLIEGIVRLSRSAEHEPVNIGWSAPKKCRPWLVLRTKSSSCPCRRMTPRAASRTLRARKRCSAGRQTSLCAKGWGARWSTSRPAWKRKSRV